MSLNYRRLPFVHSVSQILNAFVLFSRSKFGFLKLTKYACLTRSLPPVYLWKLKLKCAVCLNVQEPTTRWNLTGVRLDRNFDLRNLFFLIWQKLNGIIWWAQEPVGLSIFVIGYFLSKIVLIPVISLGSKTRIMAFVNSLVSSLIHLWVSFLQ